MRYIGPALLLLAVPAQAQDPLPPLTAEQALANAAARYTTRPPPPPCPQATGNEIVVCRELLDPESQALPSPTERALANGTTPPDPIPQAPGFIGRSQNVTARGCFIPPCAGEPPLIIDLAAIPEAPPGSDAARYSGN